MKKDSKLFKILISLDIVIVPIVLVILVGCTFAGAIVRYVVGKLSGWMEEIQAASIIWAVFAVGGAIYRTGNYSVIEILYEIFPKPVCKIVSTLIGLVVTVVLGFLCYTSIGYLQFFICTGRTTAVLNLPLTWIYMTVLVPCMPQIFNYFLVNVFGYEDEIEELVEEDEDE